MGSDRKAGLCCISAVSDALFRLQVNISLLLLDKTLREGSSFGCVIALERYSGGD